MIALAALLASGLAHADVPPPEGYVERCTVEVCGTAGGVVCRASFRGREPCEALEAQGYESRCRTRGASVWGEAMCKPEAQVAPASAGSATAALGAEGVPSATPPPSSQDAPSSAPAPTASGGCASLPARSVSGAGFLGGVGILAALGFARRRGA